MIRTWRALCMRCNHTFPVLTETAGNAYIIHCTRCGRVRHINAGELERIKKEHARSMNGSPQDCSDRSINKKDRFIIENLAGSCICGAAFRFIAKPRCPVCRSTVLRKVPRQPEISGPVAPATGT